MGHVNCTCGTCYTCRHELFTCSVCGASEGELPTDCPGVQMTTDQKEAIFQGDLNYKDGEWIEKPTVYCHACSVAGGADTAIYHLPPVCSIKS